MSKKDCIGNYYSICTSTTFTIQKQLLAIVKVLFIYIRVCVIFSVCGQNFVIRLYTDLLDFKVSCALKA